MVGKERERETARLWTVPNAISLLRLAGIGPLLWTAYEGHRVAFLWIMIGLILSDWVDGKLAILLDQRSSLGARFDSVVDWIMYAALGVCFWWMEAEVIRTHAWWILGVGVTWGASALVSLARFRRLPSYHTRAAKASWLVAGATAVYLVLTRGSWPMAWALGLVILTNLEAVAVGMVLPKWEADVSSLFQALERRKS